MQSILVLTFSGKDRIGLVEQLADVIAAHSSNWEKCRMVHLAGRFVGLLKVTVPVVNRQDLESALHAIKDLDIIISTGEDTVQENFEHFDLEVVGSDHQGIIRHVFKALAEAGVNVEELSTKTTNAPESGELLFEARARLAMKGIVSREAIRVNLESIAQDLMVDIRLLD